MSQVTTGSKTKANTEKYSGYNWHTCHIKYYDDIWDTIILEPIMNVTAPPLRRSAVSAVEAIRHVDGHVGSSQLFKRLGIQNQEECPFILKKSEIWSGTSTWSTHREVSAPARAGGLLNFLPSNSLLLCYLDQTAVAWSNFSPNYSSSVFPSLQSHFSFYLAFSCDTFLWHLLLRRHINKAVPSLMFKRETNTAD